MFDFPPRFFQQSYSLFCSYKIIASSMKCIFSLPIYFFELLSCWPLYINYMNLYFIPLFSLTCIFLFICFVRANSFCLHCYIATCEHSSLCTRSSLNSLQKVEILDEWKSDEWVICQLFHLFYFIFWCNTVPSFPSNK